MAKDSVLMEELSWTEIAERINSGVDTALLACGAIEQHGPHLPIGVDTYLGYALGEAVARKLGNTLVAPTLRPGCSDHHINFPGTLSIRRETFINLLEDYCASLVNSGFSNVVVFPSHGGNTDIMKAYVPKIARTHMDEASIYYFKPNTMSLSFWEAHEISREAVGAHAGYDESARMLVEHPDLVDMANAEEGMTISEFFEEPQINQSRLDSYTHGIDQQVPNGILGDPRGATADAGEEIKEELAEMMANSIETLLNSDRIVMELPDSVAHEFINSE